MKQQIVKNVFSNYIVSILGITTGFALVPFLLGKLGKDAFGLISLVDSTIIFFEVATVSVRTALARNATYALAQDKKEDFMAYLSTGRALLFFSSVIVLVIGLIISYFFPILFKVPPHLARHSQLLFFFVCTAFTISIPNIVFWSVLYAKQRYDLINSAMSFGTLARAGALFLLFSALPSQYSNLTVYGLIYIFFTWIQNHMIVLSSRKVFPDIHFSLKSFQKTKVREILTLSAYTSIQRLASIFVSNVTNILINIFYGPSANAIFAVSTKLPMMMRRLFTETTWSLTPTFTELAAKQDLVRLEKLFFTYTRLLIMFVSPLCFLLLIFGKDFIIWWVGDEFSMSGDLIVLFTAPLLLGIPFAVCGCINNAYGKLKVPSLVGLGYSISNVVLGVVLARKFNMGLYGFGYANLVSAFLYLSLFQPFYTCHNASIPVGRYWHKAVLIPFIPSLITAFGMFMYTQNTRISSPLAIVDLLFMAILLISSSYLLSIFVLNADEKRMVAEAWRKITSKLGVRS